MSPSKTSVPRLKNTQIPLGTVYIPAVGEIDVFGRIKDGGIMEFDFVPVRHTKINYTAREPKEALKDVLRDWDADLPPLRGWAETFELI